MTTELLPVLKPGDRATHHGIDVIAVGFAPAGCKKCPFSDRPDGNGECKSTPCEGVTWLTVLDYTTHRLTS